MKKILLFTLSLILISNAITAQVFLSPYKYAPGQKKVFVILNDDTQVGGMLTSLARSMGYVSVVTFKDQNGDKQKYKVKDVKEILIEATADDKYANAPADNKRIILSKKKRKKRDDHNAALNNLDYFVWRKVTNRRGKAKMMQLANPGYDDKIAIYIDGMATTSGPASLNGISLGSQEEQQKSYYFVKDGQDSKLIKKGQYKKMFPKLFGDCASLEIKKPKWKDFAKHVFAYDDCN